MTAQAVSHGASENLMEYISQMDNRLADRSKLEYTSRLKEISKKIQRRTGDVETLTADMLIEQIQLEVTSNGIAASTFRMYRAAVKYWLGQQAQALIAIGGEPSDYARAYDRLSAMTYSKVSTQVDRTAGKKLKFFHKECADALSRYAQEHGRRAPNAVRAAAFVKANLLVGLRPIEWFDANFASYLVRNEAGELVRDANGNLVFEHMLVVQNAKATHGRGNGERRELILEGVTTDELKALMHFADLARRFKERYPSTMEIKRLTNLFYRPMNNMIRRALTAAGYAQHDIPSLYSTRHQVVADCKSSGFDKRMIAAFFGHSSENTHGRHYAFKRHGNRIMTFKPSPESLKHITVKNITKQPEIISPELASEAEQWAAERESRKAPDGAY